jgi:hypothetical protein
MSDSERGPDDTATPDTSPAGDLSAREAEFTRRALLQAGWTAPVVLAAALPQTAAAQTAHGDAPTAHVDSHGDSHTDGPTPAPHGDIHGDFHSDGSHGDSPHTDSHSDLPPGPGGIISHTDVHSDIPHTDVHSDAHIDAHFDTHTDTHIDTT